MTNFNLIGLGGVLLLVFVNNAVIYFRSSTLTGSGQLQITSESGSQPVFSNLKDLALVVVLVILAWILYKLYYLQEQCDSAVPIGFVYVQFPDQKSPQELFPGGTSVWSDVTVEYAGLFFRADGGTAIPFGEGEQTESLPRITEASMVKSVDALIGSGDNIPLPVGEWSNYLWSGHDISCNEPKFLRGFGDYNKRQLYNDFFYSLRFFTSGDEVRPKNISIKIWKRIG